MNAKTWGGTKRTCASIVVLAAISSYASPPNASSTPPSNPESMTSSEKNSVPRMMLTFDEPAPFTSAIPGKLTICSVTVPTSSGETAATISKSPIVSLRLRVDPASCARDTPSMDAILPSNASPYKSPMSKRRRPENRLSNSIPSRTFCSDFSPIRSSSLRCPLSPATRNCSILSMPSSSWNCLIRLGPSPGMASIAIRPAGTLVYNSPISPHLPSVRASVISPAMPLPTPFTSVSLPSEVTTHRSSSSPPRVRDAFW